MTFPQYLRLALGIGGLLSAARLMSAAPVALVSIQSEAPVLDGQLNDSVWAKTAFYSVPFQASTTDASTTRFKVTTDGAWLYIAAEVEHSGEYVGSSKELTVATEDATLGDRFDWDAENLQIRIAPDSDSSVFYQFALASDGHTYDRISTGEAFDYISGWQQAIQRGEKQWTAEIAIPLQALGLQADLAAGDSLQVDVLCQHGGDQGPQAWSGTKSGIQYGQWVIDSYTAAAEQLLTHFRKSWANLLDSQRPDGLAEIGKKYDSIARDAKHIVTETQWTHFQTALAELDQFTRALLRAREDQGLQIAEVNPWALPGDSEPATLTNEMLDRIEQTALQGEYINRALALYNPSDEVMRIRVKAGDWFSSDLQSIRPSSRHLDLKQVREVITNGNPDRDALPRLREEDLIVLPPHQNAIIWLTLHSGDLEPGLWTAGLELTPISDQASARTIPLSLKVLPVQLPQGPKPYAIAWVADPAQEPFVNYPEEVVIEDFKAYGVSVHIIPRALLNWQDLAYDEKGRITKLPEMQQFSDYIDKVGREGQIYVLAASHSNFPKELQGDAKDSIVQENFAQYVRHIREFFEDKGMSHLDFAWYAADEASRGAKVQDVIHMGKAMQATDPEQQLFVTVYSRADLDALEAMAPYINMWVPKFNMTPEQFAIINQPRPGVRHLSYMVYGRGAPPYVTLRGMGIESIKLGYEGIGIWSYGEWPTFAGHSLWQNGDVGGGKYSLTYAGSQELVSSVRKEAWRMAIQDYRYIDWLQQLIPQATGTLAETAQTEVNTLLKSWNQSPDILDSAMNRFRPLLIDLLSNSGALSKDERMRAQEILDAQTLYILSNNPGPLGLPISASGGSYTYLSTDVASNPPGESKSLKHFRRAGAVAGTQEELKTLGALTDDLLGSQRFRAIFQSPSSVVFDFNDTKQLEKLIIYSTIPQSIGPLVFSIRSGPEQEWQAIGPADSVTGGNTHPSPDGGWIFNFGGNTARQLKIDFVGSGNTYVDEIRIIGEPAITP